jgi:hypothetical protein
VKALNPQNRDFFEAAADVSFNLALREHEKVAMRGQEDDSSNYFGKGGMLELLVDNMFDIGQQMNIPGAKDQDQYAAAMGYAYQLAGEYVMEQGDEDSIAEANELMMDMVLTQEDGSMMETRGQADMMAMRKTQKAQADESMRAAMTEAVNKPRRPA